MGINAELIELVGGLTNAGTLAGGTVMEFGAQVVCAAPEVVDSLLARHFPGDAGSGGAIPSAAALYARMGFAPYASIDASAEHGALVLDLNSDLLAGGFSTQYDLVTNLGTLEHCFNQYAGFKNIHDLTRPGGVMIHALTSTGNVNHGFYNYHPRFVADLAAANGYEVLKLGFTVDYGPVLHPYTLDAFRRFDARDTMIYAALRRSSGAAFVTPFDGMFAQANQVKGYAEASGSANPLETEFAPYLKPGANWENTQGRALLAEAPPPPPAEGLLRRAARRLLGR